MRKPAPKKAHRLAAPPAEFPDRDETYYRELFENASDIVYAHDLQGNLTSVNKAAQRITGYGRQETIGANISQFLTPDSLALARQMIQRKLGGAPPTTYEVAIIAKDGRRVDLEVSTRLLFRAGQPAGVQGIARDITERKLAEARLRLLESVIVHANDAVMIAKWDLPNPLDAKIAFTNEAFSRMTGYTPEEVVGKTAGILFGPRTDRAQLDRLFEALREKAPVRMELINYRKDGSEYWVDMNVVPIAGDRGSYTHWVAVQRETTGRKRAEMLERDRNQVLELVAKNEPIELVFAQLASLVERQLPSITCAVLRARDGWLHLAAGPSLTRGHARTLENVEIRRTSGPYGAAAYHKRIEICRDIAADPLWDESREEAAAAGMRACWAVPIFSGAGEVLGVFALYYREVREPEGPELDLLEMACRLAAVALEQRQLTDLLAHQAQHDALTGLPNRVLFEDRIQQALAQARRHGWLVAVLFIDLDRFKQINDTLGHSVGDALLQEAARRLTSCVRKTDSLARMGGDEFTLLLTELRDQQYALRIAEKLLDSLRAPFKIQDYELFVSASIGISLYPRDGRDPATLQRNADSAMYRAKIQGKNSYQLFMPEIGAAALELLEIENSLRRALENGELQLYYQPQRELTGRLAGLEALLVWNHPRLGLIPPTQFIPVAEESGMIVPIGAWVLRQACMQNAAWQKAGYAPVRVAVNVSAMQFARADFVGAVAQALVQSGLAPRFLELELTESVVMRDVEESGRQMDRLRDVGVSISIDDFGTGYSSLSYLRRFPIDTLKIDQSFLGELDLEPGTMPLVSAIVALAHSLNLCVVAEGVESEHQLEALRRIGCDRAQGYLLGEPSPADVTERLLSRLETARTTRGAARRGNGARGK